MGTFFLPKQSDKVDEGGGVVPVHVPKPGWQPVPQYASVVPLREQSQIWAQTSGANKGNMPEAELAATTSESAPCAGILVASTTRGIR